jgi:hypothetical protein
MVPPVDRLQSHLAAREVRRDLDSKLPAMLEQVYRRHPDWRPSPEVVDAARRPVPGGPASRDSRRVVVPYMASAEAARPHEARVAERAAEAERLSARFSLLTPALVFQSFADAVAGTSRQRFLNFQREVRRAEAEWNAFFAPQILQLREFTVEDLDRMPVFSPPPAFPSLAEAAPPGEAAWPSCADCWWSRSGAVSTYFDADRFTRLLGVASGVPTGSAAA